MKKVCAVVVTYNRKRLLQQCLDALLSQNYPPEYIIIVDNNSTDGTPDMLRKSGYLSLANIEFMRMPQNLGGAAGFYEGVKIASEKSADWIWVMDDDTVPEDNCLERLIVKATEYPEVSFFASCVRGPKGEPMNVPAVDQRPTKNGYSAWYMHLSEKLVRIETATFVSILINSKAVSVCGFPCRDFFIWGDDIEYTMRLTHYFGVACLVGDSWVCHQREGAKALVIRNEENLERLKNYHYLYRNNLIITALYKKKLGLAKQILIVQKDALMSILSGKHRFRKFCQIEKGFLEFIVHYKEFSRKIKLNIH